MLLLCNCSWRLVLRRPDLESHPGWLIKYYTLQQPFDQNGALLFLKRRFNSSNPRKAAVFNSSLNFNSSNSSSSKTVCVPSTATHKSNARSIYETTPSSITAGLPMLQYQPLICPS